MNDLNSKVFKANCCKDYDFNNSLVTSEISVDSLPINGSIFTGTRKYVNNIGIAPTGHNVIVRGKTLQSIITLQNVTLDKDSTFEYEVVGIGELVTGLNIGDKVLIASVESMSKMNIADNEESMDSLCKYLKTLKDTEFTKEVRELNELQNTKETKAGAKLRMVEYFIISSHSISAINYGRQA